MSNMFLACVGIAGCYAIAPLKNKPLQCVTILMMVPAMLLYNVYSGVMYDLFNYQPNGDINSLSELSSTDLRIVTNRDTFTLLENTVTDPTISVIMNRVETFASKQEMMEQTNNRQTAFIRSRFQAELMVQSNYDSKGYDLYHIVPETVHEFYQAMVGRRNFPLLWKINELTARMIEAVTEYYKLPKLYLYDDYDRCLQEFPSEAIYCLVDTEIKPNSTATIWPLIEKFSNDSKRSFRHDRLQRGLCMARCHAILDRFDHRTQMKYYLGHWNQSSEVTFDPNTFRGALDARAKLNRLANQCVNYELKRQYGIMGHSTVEYCVGSHEEDPLDILDITFLVVLGAIILAVCLSSFYDFRLRTKQYSDIKASTYYRTPILSQKLVLFSLARNWQTLVAKRRSTLSKDLRFIQSARFLVMYLVIAGHCMLFNCIFPLMNPEYVELNYRRLVTMLIFNGLTVIQTYFAISGFLLAVQFADYADKSKSFTAKDFCGSVLYRYLRLIPLYTFMILLDATWLNRLQDGPVWKRVAETERTFCRNNWWANLAFVNNYFTVDEPVGV
ncbi:hypothetical protein pipiens_008163 [Culex pipiens pipiens]|uniref:Uncharacterized protein n=1 Tax=Culex pipiens pipiens TaxID=38569 RepID=A0ABD1DIS2_CULPP